MSGFEVLVKLIPHAYHPEIAVVILTRLNNPYLLDAAIKVLRRLCPRAQHLATFSIRRSLRPLGECNKIGNETRGKILLKAQPRAHFLNSQRLLDAHLSSVMSADQY